GPPAMQQTSATQRRRNLLEFHDVEYGWARPRRAAGDRWIFRTVALAAVSRERAAGQRDAAILRSARRHLRLHRTPGDDSDARRGPAKNPDPHPPRRAPRSDPADPHALRR